MGSKAITAGICGGAIWIGLFLLTPYSAFLQANASLILNLVPFLGLLICALGFNYFAARDARKTFWATGILAGMVFVESLLTVALAGSPFGLIGLLWGGFWIYRLSEFERYLF